MLYNIHTHHPVRNGEVTEIENMYRDFDSDLSGKKVSMGLHPWYLDEYTVESQISNLTTNANRTEVFAIGECGLDKVTKTSWSLQIATFRRQIELAEKIQKPLIIHCVRAFNEVLIELGHVTVPVIFHGINNKWSVVQRIINRGYCLSFGKALLTGNSSTVESFFKTPLENVFLETDDAELKIEDIYKCAAMIKKIPEKEIVLQLEENFSNLFQS